MPLSFIQFWEAANATAHYRGQNELLFGEAHRAYALYLEHYLRNRL